MRTIHRESGAKFGARVVRSFAPKGALEGRVWVIICAAVAL